MTTRDNEPVAQVSQYSRESGRLPVAEQHARLATQFRKLQDHKRELEDKIRLIRVWVKDQRRAAFLRRGGPATSGTVTRGAVIRDDAQIAQEASDRKGPLLIQVRECEVELGEVRERLKDFERKASRSETDSKKLMRIESILLEIRKHLFEKQ